MNNMLKAGLLTLGLGIALCPADANAAVTAHWSYANAVGLCQAFTPGPTNTIRNRVAGAENIGAPIAVACNFTSLTNGAPGNTFPEFVGVYFHNGTGADGSVTCTLLTGTPSIPFLGPTYTVTKMVEVPAGGIQFIGWDAADNPAPGAIDLGAIVVGVNCTLPTNFTMTTTGVRWSADNGV